MTAGRVHAIQDKTHQDKTAFESISFISIYFELIFESKNELGQQVLPVCPTLKIQLDRWRLVSQLIMWCPRNLSTGLNNSVYAIHSHP